MSIGDNVKKIRREKKLTQEELALQMGISRSYLSDIENNRKNPSSKTLEILAEKLGISMSYLFEGRDALQTFTSKREELNKDRTFIKSNKEDTVSKIKEIEIQLKKFLDIEDEKLTAKELDNRQRLSKERSELITRARSLRDQIDDLDVEIAEVNDLIRQSLEYKEAEKAKNMIESFTGEAKTEVDLENIFTIAQEITINGKTLTDEEKQKALQILKITFGN
ncbi:MAG: helix-turn-helix transcriptional regulator [Niallia sp.]